MNAITTYIEQMFRPLPNSAEVRRAKTELLQMSEDRYQQLRAEGVSEHEAVGRVITQFGNLDELADDLGIRAEVDEIGEHTVDFSDAEAERYVEMRRRSSYLIAGGVALILIGITAMSLLSSDGGVFGDNMMNFNFSEPIGLAIFFIAVAAAVGMFIFAAFSGNRIELDDTTLIRLSPEATARYRTLRANYTSRYGLGLAAGVVTLILSAAVIAVTSIFADSQPGNHALEQIGTVVFFLGVALGVAILIITTMTRGTYDRLTSSGDYRPENLEANRLIDRIAGPYWMATIAIFLIWSFIWNAWHQSWIIWPIAGVLFGLLATTVGAIKRGERG